jgi:hypothetical protein
MEAVGSEKGPPQPSLLETDNSKQAPVSRTSSVEKEERGGNGLSSTSDSESESSGLGICPRASAALRTSGGSLGPRDSESESEDKHNAASELDDGKNVLRTKGRLKDARNEQENEETKGNFRPVVMLKEEQGLDLALMNSVLAEMSLILIDIDSWILIQERDSPIVKHYSSVKNSCFVTCGNSAFCS